MNTLAELIKYNRQKKQISQRELAKRIKIDNATISRIENGAVKKPSIDILIKLSNELDINFTKLLNLCEYNTNEIIKFMDIKPKAYKTEFLLNNIDCEKTQEYLVRDEDFEYIDIIKVLNGYKKGKLTDKEAVTLIHSCIPIVDNEENVIYQSEKGDIILEFPF